MNEIVFALLVMGCSHSLDVCRETENQITVYDNKELCAQSKEEAVRRIDNYPVALGRCLPISASARNAVDQAQWFFAADGSLQIAVPSSDIEVQTATLRLETAG